jgi:hypothetical protein
VRRGPREKNEERILLDQLERAMLSGEEAEVSGRDNLQTVAVLEACVRSAAEARLITEWWAHDCTAAGLEAGPDGILSLVREAPAHPLSANRFVTTTPDSKSNLHDLAAACSAGAKLRASLAQRLIRGNESADLNHGFSRDSSRWSSAPAYGRV